MIKTKKQYDYDILSFIEEVKLKLNPIHTIGETIPIGKIKYSFTIDGVNITVLKNKEKDKKTGDIKRKTIVTCGNMFPIVVYNPESEDDFAYNNKNINYVASFIDSYIMELIGYDPITAAICTRYDVLKWMLLPIYIHDFKDQEAIKKIQEDILYELICSYTDKESNTNKWENDNKGTLFCFIGKNMDTDKMDRAFFIISQPLVTNIFVIRYENGIIGINDSDKEILHYTICHKYNKFQYTNIFKKIIKNYYDFKEYNMTFTDDIE